MKPRRHFTYANVMSTIAVFAALTTGGAYASTLITGKNIKDGSIQSRDIANDAVGPSDIGALPLNSVYSANIRDGQVLGADIADNSIGADKLRSHVVGTETLDGSLQLRLDNLEHAYLDPINGDRVITGTIGPCALTPSIRVALGMDNVPC